MCFLPQSFLPFLPFSVAASPCLASFVESKDKRVVEDLAQLQLRQMVFAKCPADSAFV